MLFNNFNLSNKEIVKIIEDYANLINEKSIINHKIDEDLKQEIKLWIVKRLSKNRRKIKTFRKMSHRSFFSCF